MACCLAAITIVVWQFGGVAEGGAQLQVLNPDLAVVWRVMIVALLMVDIAITLAVWRARRWTPTLAVINVIVNVVSSATIVILLLQGHLLASDLPHQLVDVFDGYSGWRVPTALIADAVIVIAAWDSIDCIRKARHTLAIKAVEPAHWAQDPRICDYVSDTEHAFQPNVNLAIGTFCGSDLPPS